MVSKARDDLPDPERPVMTVRLSRGIAISIPFRLCSRAPRTVIWVSIGSILFQICSCFTRGLAGGQRAGTARFPRQKHHVHRTVGVARRWLLDSCARTYSGFAFVNLINEMGVCDGRCK